ncbi:hypothetical protein PTSG_06872 [Salpingoeca rosetta]|uniref:Uncharacterized protein n=1 Tax=Salpingoeca rosetta (strain ATCC 50818 / BSB-021) TaxID=946362 RepID=F2UF18_SALR5|nr:uncharacterized protein PTSG_06872 [Salpingoeca rosetta]EGD75218.1 hypothetical protein PTSG_06872 [Salpingoeca rosetta]|eukprot:XP_004992271.1 hypothetical protein PTSG_06872 [Salpingoeca rosetta]
MRSFEHHHQHAAHGSTDSNGSNGSGGARGEEAAAYLQQLEALRKSRAATLELMGSLYDRQEQRLGRGPLRVEDLQPAVNMYAAAAQLPATRGPTLQIVPEAHQSRPATTYAMQQPPRQPQPVTDEEVLRARAQHRISTMWHGFSASSSSDEHDECATDDDDAYGDSEDAASLTDTNEEERTPPGPPRVAFVQVNRRTRGAVEYEQEKKKQEEATQAELRKVPRARDPPGTIHQPLYQHMQQEWMAKKQQFMQSRDALRREQEQRRQQQERCGDAVGVNDDGDSGDSSATQRQGGGRSASRLRHKRCMGDGDNDGDGGRVRRQFKARPVPLHVLDPDRTQQLEERHLYRKLRMRILAEEKLATVAAPGAMEYRILEFTEKKKAERHADEKKKKQNAQRKARQGDGGITRPRPFNLSAPKDKTEEINRIKQEMEEDKERKREQRWPFAHSTPKKQLPYDVDRKAYLAVGRGLRTPAVRQTRAAKLRTEHTARQLEEREHAALVAEETALTRQHGASPRVREQVRTQVQRNDRGPIIHARRRMNTLVFRKTQDVLADAYREHIDSIDRRVAQQPTLMERVASTATANTNTTTRGNRGHRHRYPRDGGCGDDDALPPRVPFAPSEKRAFPGVRVREDHFAAALESSASSFSSFSSSESSWRSPAPSVSSASSTSMLSATGTTAAATHARTRTHARGESLSTTSSSSSSSVSTLARPLSALRLAAGGNGGYGYDDEYGDDDRSVDVEVQVELPSRKEKEEEKAGEPRVRPPVYTRQVDGETQQRQQRTQQRQQQPRPTRRALEFGPGDDGVVVTADVDGGKQKKQQQQQAHAYSRPRARIGRGYSDRSSILTDREFVVEGQGPPCDEGDCGGDRDGSGRWMMDAHTQHQHEDERVGASSHAHGAAVVSAAIGGDGVGWAPSRQRTGRQLLVQAAREP